MVRRPQTKYALCVQNADSEDLEMRKIYQVLPDKAAAKEGYLRIVDESGESYLYPASYFILLRLPTKARLAVGIASRFRATRIAKLRPQRVGSRRLGRSLVK